MSTQLSIALDWTYNTNHIGFLIAKENKFYEEYNLNVTLVTPDQDNYTTTPAKKIENGVVDFALCPTESVISYRTKKNPFPLISIATIFQEDLSAIVVKANKGVHSPKDLDGKTYASYKARYEDSLVKQMIKNDGGEGRLEIVYPEKLGIWDTILNDKFDSTWIFTNWEGIQAKNSHIDTISFKMKDYGVPYSYSPVIVVNEKLIASKELDFKNFLKATKKGYLFSQANPNKAVHILKKYISDRNIDLLQSLQVTSKFFGNQQNWGKINKGVISSFLNWLKLNNIETQFLESSTIFTNNLL